MDKRVLSKFKSGAILLAACVAIMSLFTVAGLAQTEAPSPYVTDIVVSPSANEAGLFFLATPDIEDYASAIATAAADGLTWSSNAAIIEGSASSLITNEPNQLPAPGSGFSFSLNVDTNASELTPAIGFNSVFYFTPDDENLGGETFASLLAALEELPQYEGWTLPEPDLLTSLGIGVYTYYQGEAVNITDRASFGVNLAEKDDGKLLFSYGAVMADREIADFSQEGYPLAVSDEEEMIWSDGASDGVITAKWWIGRTDAEEIWLAGYANPFLGTWRSAIPSADATLTFTFKRDATFDYEISGVPAEEGGVGSGGYIVSGDTMVSFLAFEGAGAYTFEVADNDTINVTEIVDVVDGAPVLGETAPFIRAEGSVIPEDAPFALDNPVVGTWEADLPSEETPGEFLSVLMEYQPTGKGVFTLKPDVVFPEGLYFVSDNYLVTYSPWEFAAEVFSFVIVDEKTLDVTEIVAIQPDGTIENGPSAIFNRVVE